MNDTLSPSFRLFAIPGFLEGMTMALDFAHTMPEYNQNISPGLADALAIAADWRAVGLDLQQAVNDYQANG